MSRFLSIVVGLSGCISLGACQSDPAAPNDGGLSAQGGDSDASGVVCTVELPKECPDPPPRYDDVSPIFKQRCATCHIANWSGPWPLDTYSRVADWAHTIGDLLARCAMPPPEAGVPLPDEEREMILTWILCKTPK